MSGTLRVLILEDSESDALLMVRELRRGGFEVSHTVVDSAVALNAALDEQAWDIILSDYSIPGFSAPAALRIVQARGLDIPFIIVSGTVNEDIAVESMKAGAHDFFSKDKLVRLVPACERELREAEERRRRRQAEESLRQSEARFAKVFQASPMGIVISRVSDGQVLDVNQHFVEMSGYERDALIGKNGLELDVWADQGQRERLVRQLRDTGSVHNAEVALRRASGRRGVALLSAETIELEGEPCILSMVHDITDRKEAEEQVRRSNELITTLRDIAIVANEATDINIVLRFVVQKIRVYARWDIGHAFFVADGNKPILYSSPIWDFGDEPCFVEFRQFTEASFDPDHAGLIRKVLDTRGSQWLDDVGHSPGFVRADVARKCGLQSAYAMPILAKQEVVGVLEFFSRTPIDDLSREIIVITSHFTAQVGRVFERQRAAEALRQSDERYQALFNRSRDSVFISDFDGNFIDANPAALNLLGYSWEDIPRLSFRALLPPAYVDSAFEALREIVQQGFQRNISEFPMLRKDGTLIYVEAMSSVIYREGKPWALQGIARDISARKEAEEKLKQYTARLELVHNVDKAILSAQRPQSIARATVSHLQQLLSVRGISVILLDPGRNGGIIISSDANGSITVQEDVSIPADRLNALERLAQGELYQIDDIAALPEPALLEQALLAQGIRSYIGVPLISHGDLVGALTLRGEQPGAFSQEDVNIAKEVSAQLAIAIYNAHLLETEQIHAAQLTALHQASLELTSSLDVDRVLDLILDYAIMLTGADNAHIFLYDGKTLSFGAAQWGGQKQDRPFSKPRPQGITQTVASTGKSVVVPDTTSSPLFKDHPWGGAVIGLPLRAADRVIGVMLVAFSQPHHFAANELRTLELMADQTAIAIHNAQLYRQIQTHADELEQRVLERTAQLQHAKDEVEAVLNGSSESIILAEDDGTIRQVNPGFSRQFGYGQDEVSGLALTTIVTPDNAELVELALQQVIKGEQFQRYEVRARRKGGSEFPVDMLVSSYARDGSVGVVCSLRDIGHLKQIESELREALAKEKELSALKSSFTSLVSHEFRTPLAVIQFSADILLKYSDRMDQARRMEKLHTIRRQVKRLVELMNDVLTVTRAETIGLEFKPHTLDLGALCQEIVEEVKIGYDHDVRIDFSYEGTCGLVGTDEFLFGHILQNLTSNAIKYSSAGSIVHIQLACSDADLTLRVADQGIGIPAEDQKRLFEAFHRATNVGQIQGTGIGMTIVKRAVEACGGSISFESVEGQGTTFIVSLPNAALEAGEQNGENKHSGDRG